MFQVIDSRDRSNPDGNIKERHRKQLEVFQAQTAASCLQVIRTQTISSSSSRWSSSSSSTPNKEILNSENKPNNLSSNLQNLNRDFENLQVG